MFGGISAGTENECVVPVESLSKQINSHLCTIQKKSVTSGIKQVRYPGPLQLY